MTQRGQLHAIAGLIALSALILGFAIWRVQREPSPAAARTIAPPAQRQVEPLRPRDMRTPMRGMPAEVTVAPYPGAGVTGLSTDDPLTAFRKQNVYPPTSRPLTIGQVDLLEPGRRHEQRRPTNADDGVEFLFTADRYFVFGAETITPTLEVWRDGALIPVTVTQAFAAVIDPGATGEPTRYPVQPGTPFAPSTIPGLRRQASIGMYVEFSYSGATQRAQLELQYTPAAGIPARFTGAFREQLVGGSLVVWAGVEVDRAGAYLIDCNLFDDHDRPLAWTRAKVELAAGIHDVELLFFGKVLIDQQARGAFHIGQLRGARFDPGRDPDLEQIAAFRGTFTTRSYAADDFSDAEYDSAHKQDMIRFLTEQQEKGVHQGAATPTGPSTPGDGH